MHSWNQGFFPILRLSSPSICKHKTLKLFHEFHKVTEAAAQNQGFFLIVRLSFPNICKHKALKLFHEFHKVTEAAAQRCSVKKCFLKNFAKLTRKSLFQSLFLIELQATACNFFKREALAQLFYCKFSENFKNIFLL